MTKTEKLRDYIRSEFDLDLVGFAAASALDGEPEGHRPGDLLPGAKSIIVFGRAMADGAVAGMLRALEDKKMAAQSSYAAYAQDLAPNFLLVNDTFNIAAYVEDVYGEVAMPLPFGVQQSMEWDKFPAPPFADPYGQGMPLDVFKAAVAAGLGEFGWSNRFITPEFGPRQQISAVLTTLELDCDSPRSGERLCDPEKCGVCARLCPTGALSAPGSGDTAEKCVGGECYGCAKLNVNSCTVASLAFRKEFQGRMPVPNQIMDNAPTDEELIAAFEKKPLNGLSVDHYPRYFCDRCLVYCPLGNWRERFYETGLSRFDPEKA